MTTPNLFNFATSELSQDAFLCWLLSWADSKYAQKNKMLHQVATHLIARIYQDAASPMPSVLSVNVKTQYKNMDILCLVNDDTVIMIEDKVGTVEHSDQIRRYRVILEKDFPNHKLIFVYLQTGDQSHYKAVTKHGYIVIHRKDLLTILESPDGRDAQKTNNIIEDYALFLRKHEDRVNSYQHLPLDQWSSSSWIGFYKRLQNELRLGNWGYVPNQSGGFMCFYWSSCHKTDEHEVYLQLEEEVLCFKIGVTEGNESKFSHFRTLWHKKIVAEGLRLGLSVVKPTRFGSGYTMTVATLKDYRVTSQDGTIDIDKTCDVLRQARELLLGCQL